VIHVAGVAGGFEITLSNSENFIFAPVLVMNVLEERRDRLGIFRAIACRRLASRWILVTDDNCYGKSACQDHLSSAVDQVTTRKRKCDKAPPAISR
jgi:hypothetical protein